MGVPVHELKKKKESLMTYFRSNLKKKISSLKSGAGEDDAYKPIWIFYDAMEVFLKDVYESSSICNTEQNVSKTKYILLELSVFIKNIQFVLTFYTIDILSFFEYIVFVK